MDDHNHAAHRVDSRELIHNSIKLIRVTPENVNLYLPSLVNCYREVFGGEDWREWKICSHGHKFSKRESEHLTLCPVCGQKLNFYWPAETVRENILREISFPHSVFIIALYDGRVIGFTWGYSIEKEFAREHFDNHLPRKLVSLMNRNGGWVWYQNEIGVVEEFRGNGIATRLYKTRMRIVLHETNFNDFIIRTFSGAKTYKWYRKRIGYKILTRYKRDDLGEWRYLLWADRKTISRYVFS